MVTIKDIANKAGVSPTTVSNVIHGYSHRVSEATVRRIKKIIDEMGYTPNLSARSLVSSSSRIIGMISRPIAPDCDGTAQAAFRGALTSGVDLSLREANYYLMLRAVGSVPELLSFLSNWNLDGLILLGAFPDAFHQALRRQACPALLVGSHEEGNQSELRIDLQDRHGGYVATKHLLECGHRRILFCGPPEQPGPCFAKERLAGYRQALAEYCVPFHQELLRNLAPGVEEAQALGRALAQRDDFSAILAANDTLGAGLLAGLREGGKRIPEDVSVVSFDDLCICGTTYPPLTAVHKDATEMGRVAVRMLLATIHGETRPDAAGLSVRLVERRSVARV